MGGEYEGKFSKHSYTVFPFLDVEKTMHNTLPGFFACQFHRQHIPRKGSHITLPMIEALGLYFSLGEGGTLAVQSCWNSPMDLVYRSFFPYRSLHLPFH